MVSGRYLYMKSAQSPVSAARATSCAVSNSASVPATSQSHPALVEREEESSERRRKKRREVERERRETKEEERKGEEEMKEKGL